MSEETNCHECQYLTREYDNNDCEYTFLYGCLYSVINCVTTDQLQKISDCHYENPERKVRSFKLIPEEEYDGYLRWKNNKDRISSSSYYHKLKNNSSCVYCFSIYNIEWFFCMEEGQMSWNAYYPMDEDDKVTINGYYHKIV